MKRICNLGLVSAALMPALFSQAAALSKDDPRKDGSVRPAPNGLEIPKGIANWPVV